MPPKTEAQKKAQREYMSHYTIARVRMTPDRLDEVKEHAAKHNESVSGFVNRAIDETMERDNGSSEE